MATHAALASSRIPSHTSLLPSKSSHSSCFPTQCLSKRLEVAEFSGLRSSGRVTYAKNAREASLFDVVAAQATPMTAGSTPVKGQTVAKLKVAINGFGRIGRNFLRCWHGRKNSPVDLVVNVAKKGISAEDVNAAFRKAADGPLKGILAVCDVPLVSVDFRCSDVSSTIDSSLTMVMGDDMVKVVAWYDNEWGYSQRVVDLAHLVASKWPGMPAQGSGDPLEDFCETSPAEKECKVYEA
ncbi:hypothetical protein CsSME_00036460 [Camellia sinensis var. sinensis]